MPKLDEHVTRTLVAMARQLFPHDMLDDSYYRRVVETVDAEADEGQVALLRDGVRLLDGARDAPFVDLAEADKLATLTAIEGSPFFDEMRAATVRQLYNNPHVWRRFGFEGPSALQGGYVKRGFDDIPWLPEE